MSDIHNITDHFLPDRQNFGETLADSEETFFGEKMIVMRANRQMLLRTIGDGAPHRLNNLRIGLCTEGYSDNQVNLEARRVTEGALEFYGAGTLFQLNDASPDFCVLEIIFEPSYLTELLSGNIPAVFRAKALSDCVDISPQEQQRFKQMMLLLLQLAKTEGELHPVTRSMAQTILRYTITMLHKHMNNDQRMLTRQETIFHEFARLVTLSHGRQRRHSYYASQLNVSQHYLSIAVKQASGISAKEWIDRVVVAEIKILLVHTTLTVSQIAHKLDFPSDSFLCKFFRRHVGITPLEFRKAYM